MGTPEDGAGAMDGVVCVAAAEKAVVVGMAVVVEYVDSAVVP